MDPIDAFYQQLDSEKQLQAHGQSLVDDAREALAADPSTKVAGLITTPDSPDAVGVREMLAKRTGQPVPVGLMVGIVPRALVEQMLTKRFGTEPWMEQPSSILLHTRKRLGRTPRAAPWCGGGLPAVAPQPLERAVEVGQGERLPDQPLWRSKVARQVPASMRRHEYDREARRAHRDGPRERRARHTSPEVNVGQERIDAVRDKYAQRDFTAP